MRDIFSAEMNLINIHFEMGHSTWHNLSQDITCGYNLTLPQDEVDVGSSKQRNRYNASEVLLLGL